ncbi:MAG: FAD-dependent oxidoreductase [Planctomycetota bacterium]|jgi:ribulose 1,5-bisphosphate synthetase/thiazole synthase
MMDSLSRRSFLRKLALGSTTALAPSIIRADQIYKGSKIVEAERIYRSGPAIIVDGKIVQPRREIPVICETDVLVVGGGCAGVMSALAAARTGAKVTLVERYGCFGGLWTAGLVLIVLATHVDTEKGLRKCVRGIGDELLDRLLKIKGGIINQGPGMRDPTSDPEATKYVMAEMLREAGVEILLNSWVTNAVMEGNSIEGILFESKAGCHAVRARVVVDASGDGDVFGAAGAEHVRHIHRIGLVHRIGNVDRITGNKKKQPNLSSNTPLPSVRWVNMQGPQGDCLDIRTLTQCELDGRRAVWEKLKKIQQTPGREQVFMLDTASQLGIRASRTLIGLHEVTFEETSADKKYDDVVAVGGAYKFVGERACQIPYRALVPVRMDNLLATGRCVAADNLMLNYTRLIGPCLVTGHAAGTAAALAVDSKCRPRDVDVPKLQQLLKNQGAYLG